MKRPRCRKCKHTMKGHKKIKCSQIKVLIFNDGSKYVGSTYDDKPSGKGVLDFPEGTYEGEFVDGKRNGHGIETLLSGKKYEGNFQRNLYHGEGKLMLEDGSMYIGHFDNGTYHGRGTLTHTESSYSGEWNRGTYHGEGTYITPQGTYKGQFYFNVQHGHGTFADIYGGKYTGKWRRGLREGHGILTTQDGSYVGNWSKDMQSGHGKWTSKNHGVYIGQFKHGKRHKKGSQTWPDGTTYTGGWSKGKKTGYGIQKWTDGSSFEGFWLKDKYNGSGTLKLSDGSSFKGEWEHNKREGIFTEIRPDGTISIGYWNNDLRHGTFKINDQRVLYIWNSEVSFDTLEAAKRSCIKMNRVHDYEGTRVILEHYPKICTWNFFWKYDKKGINLYLLEKKEIVKALKRCAYKLFKDKRYIFLENLMKQCPEDSLITVHEKCEELFDTLSKTFVPNPWMVKQQSYSEETKHKLLSGIFLGEFGRCPPKDPFTRLPLHKNSGTYLSKHQKKAKNIYKRFMKAIDEQPTIREMARSFDVQDFEELLKNAREAGDRDTIKKIMKERNEYIQQHT